MEKKDSKLYTVHVGQWGAEMNRPEFWMHTLYAGGDPARAQEAHQLARREFGAAFHVASFCHLMFMPSQRIDRCIGSSNADEATITAIRETVEARDAE